MRILGLAALAAGTLCGQAMTEAAAAAAGSTVGSVAGKQISTGIDKILGKTSSVLENASKSGAAAPSKAPLLQVGPGKPKEEPHNVPPPPPAVSGSTAPQRTTAPAPQLVARPTPQAVYEAPAPPPPPPPAMTREQLAAVATGTSRSDLLATGVPASRVTMFDGGHLVEIYRYQTRDTVLGVVRLRDGAVSEVAVQP